MKYRLIPKKKLAETSAYITPPVSGVDNKMYKKNFNENLDIDSLEKFSGSKEAIKWCNKKFEELQDVKYK